MKRYAIGIDPGVNTGYAVYDRQDKYILETATMDFWKVINQLKGIQPSDAVVVVEIPGTFTYQRNELDAGRGRDAKNKMQARIRREAELLAEGIEQMGFEVRRQTPTRSKWTAEQLARYTGITKRTNEHVRDAIALVWQI